jgi:probable rRNA maturation factor
LIRLQLMPGRWPHALSAEIQKYQRSIPRLTAAFAGIRWLGAGRDFMRRKKHDIQVHLISDAKMARINEEYRSKQGATDVLSFAYRESAAPVFEHEPVGEVYIALQTAARQGKEYGHPLADELRILTVHGALHVMGYDHESTAEATTMRGAEAKILKKTGTVAALGLIGR